MLLDGPPSAGDIPSNRSRISIWSVTRLSAGCLRLIFKSRIAIGDFPPLPAVGGMMALSSPVPRDRVRAVEAAFLKTLKDPEFVADAERCE
jgi:hypothetical protein